MQESQLHNPANAIKLPFRILFTTTLFFLVATVFQAIDRNSLIPLPENSMILELVNRRDSVIDLIEIKHGNTHSQETIVVLQIRPGESRRIVMNHAPGLGFNLTSLVDGEKTEVCIGKTSDSRILRQTFHNDDSFEVSDIKTEWF